MNKFISNSNLSFKQTSSFRHLVSSSGPSLHSDNYTSARGVQNWDNCRVAGDWEGKSKAAGRGESSGGGREIYSHI